MITVWAALIGVILAAANSGGRNDW